jgi:hypothetical protein
VTAQRALNPIANSPEGARNIFDADLFGIFPQLLNSPAAKVREWTVKMEGTLATHGIVFKPAPERSFTASRGDIFGHLVSPFRVPLKHTHSFLP